ncbi:MAG: ribonuclease E/G [Alphaproteobacteria bacterium]|nr:ribonuclease E/G [Alphaproteobacteria bacterium]
MSGFDFLADEVDGLLYVAIVRKSVLVDLYADLLNPPTPAAWASIYLGKVTKLDTRLDAAFVDMGEGLTGYLPAKHATGEGGVAERLRGGQMILVQVRSEAKRNTLHESHKIPRLTMSLHVPGLFLTHIPTAEPGDVSSKIEDGKIPAVVSSLKGRGGWVVQRAAENAADADIEHEAKYLQEIGQKILAAKETMQDKPGRVKAGPNAMFRALTDYGVSSFEHIHVGNKQLLDLVTSWCARHLPALATSKRLRLFKPEKPGQKLFDIYDVFSEIEALQEDQVCLNSGGTIIIEPTSAMTVIDVNQGSADSITIANQSAAREIARQCRLRNLSGAILIDFINMDQKNERARLQETMQEVFAHDTANAQVHGFTRLGIIELTRKRRTASLAEKLKKNQVVSA